MSEYGRKEVSEKILLSVVPSCVREYARLVLKRGVAITCTTVSHEQQPDAADSNTLLVALLQMLLDVLTASIKEAFVQSQVLRVNI